MDGATPPPPSKRQARPPPSSPRPQCPPRPQDDAPPKGGGDGADDPLVGTKVHVPYPKAVEVGTVTGVHRRKAGVVWVGYPSNPTLYEVARGLLFPSPEAAQEPLERVRNGKGKATPPPPAFGPASPED